MNNTGNIRLRGDSAFYRRDLFKYLENNQVTYYIRVKNFKKNIRESVMDMVINQADWNDFDYTEPYYGEYTIQINQVTYYIRVKNFKKNIRESVMDMVINQADWNDFDYTEPYYGEYTIQINQVTYYIRVKNFKKNIRESVMDMVINQADWNDFDYTEPYYGEYTIQINKTKKAKNCIQSLSLRKRRNASVSTYGLLHNLK